MRKLLFILFVLISFAGYSQKEYIHWVEADDITNNRYFIYHGDTIDFTMLSDGSLVFKSDSNTVFITLKQLRDSLNATAYTHNPVTLNQNALDGGLSLNGQEVGFRPAKLSQSGYLTSQDWYIFNSKISFVSHNGTLLGNGTPAYPLSVNLDTIATKLWATNLFLKKDGDFIGSFGGHSFEYYLDYNNFTNVPPIHVISNEAYGSNWLNNMDGASKNAIYNKIESLAGASDYYFEKELATNENIIDVGFYLTDKCAVSLNGRIIPQEYWEIDGTDKVKLNFSIMKYDYLVVKQ